MRAGQFLLCVVLAGLCLAASSMAAPPRRPNILLLFADDQRADTIGAWGNPHIRTPHLDTLAKGGFSFRNNYCFGANSGAVCVPSRAMLMSGRTWFDVPHHLGGVPLLPELLRKAGYVTFATGKWHNGQSSFVRAFPEGKSVFFGGMADHTKVRVADVEGGKIVRPRTAAKFSSEEFANAAVDFLNSYQGEAPFFCYVAFTAPHDPRNPPEKYRQMYLADRPPLPENFLPQHPFDNGFAKNIRDENLAGYPRDPEVIRDQLAEYYGLVTHLDEQVGRILAALRATGREEDTVVLYAADHGLAMGSHGLLGKQSVYEHSMKCPLIAVGPGIPAGKSTEAFTYLFDLFPTICQLAGADAPADIAGHSLVPLWRGEASAVRDSVFLPYSQVMRAVRDQRWKLIVYPQINHVQLFDLASDPHERKNLAENPAQAQRIEELTALLRQWQTRVSDKQPLSSEKPKPKEIRYDDFQRKPDPHQPPEIVQRYFQ